MRFPRPKGREKQLEPLGFIRQQAEWITLVCLHSGLFTGDQADAFLRLAPRTARDFVHALLEARISGRPVADAQTVDGRWIYRIFSKAIYRDLGLANVRHRREASIPTRHGLISAARAPSERADRVDGNLGSWRRGHVVVLDKQSRVLEYVEVETQADSSPSS